MFLVFVKYIIKYMSNQLVVDSQVKHKKDRNIEQMLMHKNLCPTRKDRDIEQMLVHIGNKSKEPRKGFRQYKEDKELKLMLNCPGLFFRDPNNPIPKLDPEYKRKTAYFMAPPKITKDTILNDIKIKEDEEEKIKVKAEAKEKEKAEIKALALTLIKEKASSMNDQDVATKIKEEAIEKINAETRAKEKAEAIKLKEIAEGKAKEKAEMKAKEKEKFLAKLKANVKAQSDKVKSKS